MIRRQVSRLVVYWLRKRCCPLGSDDHGHTSCWHYGWVINDIERWAK